MNYVVSLLGQVLIKPPLESRAVRMLNAEFAITHLLILPPDGWTPVRFRIAPEGTHLVTDEDLGAKELETFGEYRWAGSQLAYVVEQMSQFECTVEGDVYQRGDHLADIFLLHVDSGRVTEHRAAYRRVGSIVLAPVERLTIEKGEWFEDA